MQRRVAVFVDGENLGSAHAKSLLRVAGEHGDIVLARVYGDVARLNGWREEHRFTLVHAGAGKNAADILMAIEAVDLARDGRFDACILGSSDRDFSHLATRLRERGLTIVGAGETKTPERFRATCSLFIELGGAAATCEPQGASAGPGISHIDRKIERLLREAPDESGITLQELGTRMNQQHAVTCAEIEDRNWRTYFDKRKGRYDLNGDRVSLTSPRHVA
jgi:hypothetical protein